MGQKGLNRRQAVGLGAAAAAVAGAALLPGSAGAQEARGVRRRAPEDLVPRQNIGIQLYSLRDMQAASVQNTISLLGGIGYPEVELFTMQGLTAATWRGILEGANVRAIAAHVGIDRWRTALDTVLDEAETLGMQYVGVPGIFPNPPATRETYRALAREFDRYAERVAAAGCGSTTTTTTSSSLGTAGPGCTTSSSTGRIRTSSSSRSTCTGW